MRAVRGLQFEACICINLYIDTYICTICRILYSLLFFFNHICNNIPQNIIIEIENIRCQLRDISGMYVQPVM